MNCSCGAQVDPGSRFCGSCGAQMPAGEPGLPRPIRSDPEVTREHLRQAEAAVQREEEKAAADSTPPPWTPPPELRASLSPATVYGTPQMMGAPPPSPPPPAWGGPAAWSGPQAPPPPASASWGVPPSPAAWAQPAGPSAPPVAPTPWVQPPAPAPVYGGPPVLVPSAPPAGATPVRILLIPALGTLCGVGVGFAMGHDLVPALIGGVVAGAAAIWHASRLR